MELRECAVEMETMSFLLKSPLKGPGVYPIVTRGEQLRHLSFTVVELGGGLTATELSSGDEELAVDVYSGSIEYEIDSPIGTLSGKTRERGSLTETPEMLYIPASSKLDMKLVGGESARIGVFGALGKGGVAPLFIPQAEAMINKVGKDNFHRTVATSIADNVDAAHLIVGETLNEPGAWSSCPPHKHDENNPPGEVPMEEVYFFQTEPKGGFGFMRLYTHEGAAEPFDQSYAVEDGDTVVIPRGYHPVASLPGYRLHYTWALAGDGRTYGAWADDPRYAWIKEG